MASARTERLVVTDGDGVLVGVLSIADLVERAPKRQALQTLKAVLWRDALGPRGGARPGQPLLRDLPLAPQSADDSAEVPPSTVFRGGRHAPGMKEFPI